MMRYRAEIEQLQSAAIKEARKALVSAGFAALSDRRFAGRLVILDRKIPIRIELPPAFPLELPHVYVQRESLPKTLPHVESSGKLCLLPSSGILVDVTRPGDLIREVVEKARAMLQHGMKDDTLHDFATEFLAYWQPVAESVSLDSLCVEAPPSREIVVAHYSSGLGASSSHPRLIAADSSRDAAHWIRNRGHRFERSETAYFIHLRTPSAPPAVFAPLELAHFLEWLASNCAPAMFLYFSGLFAQQTGPFFVLLAIPGGKPQELAIAAARLAPCITDPQTWPLPPLLSSETTNRRSYRMPHLRQVERIDLHRYDPGYLLPRGGARQSLLGKRIVLVGCGAVGSALAVHTASMGCGSLLLVDHDRLSADNIHRHALGALYVGAEKAGALAGYLRLQFPHLHFDYRPSLIETVIKEEPELLEQADLVFLALGNETIELLVNDLLRVDVHRIHAWVDPLGLGGHVLAIPKGGAQGCYRCLFGHSEQHGLFNRASFVAPGQQAQRTFSGCAGFFTPFSYQDADQTALLAARQAATLMSSPLESRTILTSWYGNPASALEMGLNLSDRAKLFEPCRCASTEIVSNSACACSQW